MHHAAYVTDAPIAVDWKLIAPTVVERQWKKLVHYGEYSFLFR
jgi:hypothetical protein